MTLKRLSMLCGAVATVAGLPAVATDITISDGIGDTGFGAAGQAAPSGFVEDNTVELNATADQTWDYEAFTVSAGKLGVVAGFDMKSGAASGGNTAPQGDIFVKIGGTINPVNLTSVGYNYVIHFTSFSELDASKNVINGTTTGTGVGNVAYSIYAANTVSVISSGGAHITPGGALFGNLAWQANVTGAVAVKNGAADYTNDVSDAASGGYKGGNHDLITGIDLSGLGILPTDIVSVFTTMGCGNDALLGQANGGVTTFSLPDGGATVALLGASLTGLALARRRMA